MKKICDFFKKYNLLPVQVKASVWFMVCSILQKGISFITTPIFTRMLTTEQYGQVTVYSSWYGIICIFTTLNLQAGSFNSAQIKFEEQRHQYTSTVQGLVTVMSCIAIGVYFLMPSKWDSLLRMSSPLTLVMLVHILFQFTTSIWMANKRFDYDYRPIIAVTLLTTFAVPLVGIAAVCYASTWNEAERGTARILSMAAVQILVGVYTYISNLRRGKKFFDSQFWKFALSFNIPLLPYYLSQVIFNTSDRIMIADMVGDDKAGIYGLSYTLAVILIFVKGSFNDTFLPWFYRRIKANDGRKVAEVGRKLILAFSTILLALIFVAPEAVLILGGREYLEAVWIVPPVTASLLFNYFTDFTCNIEFYFEKKGLLVAGTIMSAVVNIVLNYFGIKYIGYIVAGYTTLISYILFWIFLYVGARKVCREHSLDEKQFINFGFQMKVAVGFLVISGIIMITYTNIFIRYGMLVMGFIAAFIYRRQLINYVKQIKTMKGE